jgi:hypothetical protein
VSGISIEVRGVPEAQKMLEQLTGQPLQNRVRRALRAGLAPMRKAYRSQAKSGRYPRRFRATRTRNHRNPLGVSLAPQSPLGPVFDHGARPHAIPITKGPFAGRTVHHPGMAARPITVPAFNAARDEAEAEIERVLFEGLR